MERDKHEREIIVRLFQLSNALQTYLDNMLKEFQITSKQFFLMIIIGTFEGSPRIGEVSERFGTSRQNVKQVLLKLEKSNYVRLFKDEFDSRITRVTLTEHAKLFWEERNEMDDFIISEIFKLSSTDDLAIFNSSLIKTIEQINGLSNE